MDAERMLSVLTVKDTKQGYGAFLELERLSEESDDLYPYTERFADMVSDRAWAVRCRGFRLFCAAWTGHWQSWRTKSPRRCGRLWRRCWMWCRISGHCGL